jgi:cardiolipin synthase
MLAATTVVLALTTALLGYILWGKSRLRPVAVDLPAEYDLASLLRSMAALTWGRVVEGNGVTFTQNSAFFDELLKDVGKATHHVHLETFLWEDGVVSDRVAAALAQRAADGIAVRVLVDQRGAKHTDPRVWQAMRAAGCDFRVFHRARIGELARYNRRDHRKIAVIDGRIGYTFGHGIADMWGGHPEAPLGWRDTAARLEGPVVGELQAAFFDNWARSAGRAPAGEDYFPVLPRAGSTPMHVAFVAPRETISAVQRLYYFAIAAARREIILQNPYFLPDREALRLFRDAVRRGVRVAIMLPTAETSDFAIVQHASHHYYGALLALGARVFEYTRSGLHQKVMIVDGEWCSIGSTNFDPRSFRINDEITVAMCDRDAAAELRAAFDGDLQHAREWTLERWHARSLRHRLTDRVSALFKRQL